MIWEEIHWLWGLAAIPVLYLMKEWRSRENKKKRKAFFSDEMFRLLRKGYWNLGANIQFYALLAAFFFLILAAAGPKIGTEVREIKRQGIDLMIALDLSASMNAEDIKPSRLAKAKYEINRLIERLKGDRVGLIVFTGEAYLQAPMTLDYSALRLFLNIAESDQMPSATTNFSEAFKLALKGFETTEETQGNSSKVLLIISDGENQGEDFKEALQQLLNRSINIYTLGIGTKNGAAIPLYDKSSGSLIGYKRDSEGKVVTTRLETALLKEIANLGGGNYYEIQRGNDGIDAFLARIDELEKGEISSQEYADFKNQYQWMAFAGLLFLCAFLLIPSYKKPND